MIVGTLAKILHRISRRLPFDELGCGPDGATMRRWRVVGWRGWQVRLHQFIADDLHDMHDHSAHGISLLLTGRYVEETPQRRRVRHRGSVQVIKATHVHRVLLDPSCRDEVWSLFFMTPKIRDEWGYYRHGRRIPVFKYLAKHPCREKRRRARSRGRR